MNFNFNETNLSESKSFRLLSIYERLNRGEQINKLDIANLYNVTEKTIQRDIDDLRAYLSETHMFENEVAIKYSKSGNCYYLVHIEREWLTNEEVLAICKILLESRAFNKNELDRLLRKILMHATLKDRTQVEEIINNEKYYYVPPQHKKMLLSSIWELSNHITQHKVLDISYKRTDGVVRQHKIKPVSIMFSEFYFYLIAYMADDSKDFPTVFRIDRIASFKETKEKFHIPYKDRFNDGEFRNRVQFMFSGELKTVTFEYVGPSIEAVLDRLPTAKIISHNSNVYKLKVEVFGNGIDMWLKSQGNNVQNIS